MPKEFRDSDWKNPSFPDGEELWRDALISAAHAVPVFLIAHLVPLPWASGDGGVMLSALGALVQWVVLPLTVMCLLLSGMLALRHPQTRTLLAPSALYIVSALMMRSTLAVLA